MSLSTLLLDGQLYPMEREIIAISIVVSSFLSVFTLASLIVLLGLV
ncbi:MAG: hypothetical protein Q9M39_00590 [Sulfurovum sp.]|nr:hypothetical protein [Sulfurovum sp.]